MSFLDVHWLWLYAGGFLMLAELVMPGFVIFFFGLAAATVGALLAVVPKEAFDITLTGQLALFSFFSILYLVTLRRLVKSVFLGDSAETSVAAGEYVGRVGTVVSVIRPDVPGRILLGDAEWNATAAVRLEPGAEVRVTAQQNLTLAVEAL